ncbi:[protein-PII] uridylyltransferase [Sphingosinicella rhizophila]|uniref:Bifunctional uridylyltransferase/uridylyl-removing enzyme n=1 Tax=Sphingosinicella rhizophila TaxID=3050082 RepID=A0ABU3Q845_9SPHN|nr:[protein-PII] uridylyltransferase [Sphingosinicella sp. GR2756]MDT9599502.1 [protein-PII] uridylyltransferase [Sphingosinicella sp. GR2756]
MAARFAHIPNRRSIIDRRALADQLAAMDGEVQARRAAATRILKQALADGRTEIARRVEEKPYQGTETAAAYAFLTDQILRLVHDFAVTHLYPLSNPTASERLLLVAVGGYGRGEMALHSDVDIAFVTPWKPTGWTEQAIESILYLLWDLGLKIGHASRSIDDMLRVAAGDHTVRTAILEMRYLWGDEPLFEELQARFWKEVVGSKARQFVTEKLEERNARHERMGDSRYVVEPNVKEGKGALRDLHTLYWIGKYAYRVRNVAELVDVGLLSAQELRQFQRAERFLWAVRCNLHLAAGRAEERLTFGYQREIAERMHYADRPGRSPVERFMRHYFLNAKLVGDLTGIFLAHLDEKFANQGRRFGLPALLRRPRKLDGFVLDRGRLALPRDDFFEEDPVRLVQLFALADRHGLEIHPLTMRAAGRDSRLIGAKVRSDPRANHLFLDVLTSPRDPETVLRWMNEAGVFGRFMPDFGRVVAQMQFDMYHHYTVDEHTIRAIGLLARIEQGMLKEDHPLATSLFKHVASRRVLYVAVLLHDIAKGRGGDHSVLGADVARTLCPRLGLSGAETETVAWLVRWHLLMSATAFKRDLTDPKTVIDFVERVKSLERLRLLFLLTVVDIRAVGPGVWNSWKRQLLRDLFEQAEEILRLGHKQKGRRERIAAVQAELAERLGWDESRFGSLTSRLPDSYWLSEPIQVLERNALYVDSADRAPAKARPLSTSVHEERGATLVTIYVKDEPGLFYRVTGAISLAGGNIIDARIHTTMDGMALDNFLVQSGGGGPLTDRHQLRRLDEAVAAAVGGQEPLMDRLEAKALRLPRADAFPIEPNVFVDNVASNRYTVVEVNARDRAALLSSLALAFFQSKATIHSAHIATYGERAVDVFYVTDMQGQKIENPARLKSLQARLLKSAERDADAKNEAA